jgi:hypothetical protein
MESNPSHSPGLNGLIFQASFHRVRKGLGIGFVSEIPAPSPIRERKASSAAKALALAHRLERAVELGEVADYAGLARRLGLSRARVSVLLALSYLAPDIQEEVLSSEPRVSLLALAAIARSSLWAEQRAAWAEHKDRLTDCESGGKNLAIC